MNEHLHLNPPRSWNKPLLIAALLLAGSGANAQISVYVQQPESEAGALNFSWSESWGADLALIENAVVGELALVSDGTEADSLGCNDLVNGSEISGRIALVYRGSPDPDEPCEFGGKALNAQEQGAIGVVIVNNIPGAPVDMGAGAVGASVTIPVVMVSDVDGQYLRSMMDTTSVELRIGTLTGVFAFNLGLEKRGILLPRAAAIPAELAMDAEDLNFELGAWVFNFGNESQSGITLQAEVLQDGNSIYNETSTGVTIDPNDSSFIALPPFSQSNYSGLYTVNYTILGTEQDALPINDSFSTTMHIGDIFSYADVDPATGIPIADTHIQPAGAPASWRSCIYFTHPNASRIAATGLHVNLTAAADATFGGSEITAQGNLWDVAITSPNDRPSDDGSDLSEEVFGNHILDDSEEGETIYVAFDEPLILQDDANYLFCLISNDANLFHGYDADLVYDQNMEQYQLPVSNFQDATWFNGFTGFDTHPSIGVATVDVNMIGIEENNKIDITPFPNPTADLIKIPVAGQAGNATLEIFDMAGAKVADRNVNVGNGQVIVNMEGVSNGTYMFNMIFEDGRRSNFRVVVNR